MQAVSYGWCAAAISSSLFCHETPEMPEGAYGELFRHGGIETHGNASSEKSNLVLGGPLMRGRKSEETVSETPEKRGNRDTILM